MTATHTPDLEEPQAARADDDVDPVDTGMGAVTDDLLDLTDRRRVLLRSLLGVDVKPQIVNLVFAFPDDD